jgi:hypothetical protein
LAAATLFAGCQRGAPPAAIGGAIAAQTTSPAAASQRETWDIVCIGHKRVGYAETVIRRGGPQADEVAQTLHLAVERFGQTSEQEVRYRDSETPSGGLLNFDFEVRQAATPIKTTGRARGGKLELEVVSQGQTQRATIPWSAEYGGLLAPELSLLRHPMKAGQRRTLQHLAVDNQLSETELVARQEEDVKLLSGSFRLLRIDTLDRLSSGQKIKGAVWTDPAGEVLKTWIEPMDMETFRVPKQVALSKTPAAKLDLGWDISVRLNRPLPGAQQTKRVRYRVRLTQGDPAAVFASGPTQKLKPIDAHTAEVTVYAIRPGVAGNAQAADQPPTDAERQPNNFIQSNDERIVADARKATAGLSKPWDKAVALERLVHEKLAVADFSQAFATAAEAARSSKGDCKAHAVYLAALARASGIPARVAVGLVYVPSLQALGYHMWTEVYVDQRWIPLDATLGLGGIGAGHLKLAHSSLAGTSAYGSFIPIIDIVGRLNVEVLGTE